MTYLKVNTPINKSINGWMNDLLNEFPTGFGKSFREEILAFPPVNITEHNNSYKIEVMAPGYDKTDFNVKLDGQLLVVSAEKKESIKEENTQTIRKEFSHKSFKRSFTVDDKIDGTGISAKYDNGILHLELPKKEIAKPDTKEIAIN